MTEKFMYLKPYFDFRRKSDAERFEARELPVVKKEIRRIKALPALARRQAG